LIGSTQSRRTRATLKIASVFEQSAVGPLREEAHVGSRK
jgi:hypothetical protein